MRLIFVLATAISSFCFLASCAQNAANQNSASTKASPAQPVSQLSPTETLIAYREAARKKDLNEVEKYLSKGTIQIVDQAAAEQKTTADEVLSAIIDEVSEADLETRDEQINGSEATIEYKNNVTGGWDKLPFVKEETGWKIALDKQMQDVLKNSDEVEINKQGGEEPSN